MTKNLRTILLLFIFTALAGGSAFAQSFKSENELRKNAEKDFKNEDYAAALPLYSQLLSLNQRDAKLNYRYGVCLLMADKDKGSAYNYLEFASHNTSTETDVFFYMGKALQLKYRFDEAISNYEEFSKRAGVITARKMDTDRQIETCKNAKELLRNRVNAVVKNSKEVSKSSLYGSYNDLSASGKLLPASEVFLSPVDKHKMTAPMMYLSADGQTIYYATYGKNEDNGKDIYVIHKLPTGAWGIPENAGAVVNTKYDEDYPYMDTDGKTLYFSSKGHNSMGGYDLFKTTYNTFDNTWTEPVNLGAGINSPDDDFFYMPVSDGEAQFASTKETSAGTLTVYRIEVAKNHKLLATVHGTFRSLDHPERTDAKISVLRKSDNGLVATARTDQRTGAYDLAVPSGGDYQVVVQGGGYMAHVEDFTLPASDRPITVAQQIDMNRSNGNEQIEIRNKYLQNDSSSLAAIDLPKETQVIKDEYPSDKLSAMKLKPYTVDGQVVYATVPASKDAMVMNQVSKPTNESITQKAQDIRDAVAIADKQEGETKTDKTEIKKEGSTTTVTETIAVPKANEEDEIRNGQASVKNETTGHGSIQNDSVSTEAVFDSLATDEKTADMQETKINVESTPAKMTEYKSNISDNELIKIAYNDAKESEQEAKILATDASAAHAAATVKDSTSKAQLNEMLKALKTGDEATARELSRESQVNADSAQQAKAHAADLDDKVRTKQEVADKAFADAKELEKNYIKEQAEKTAMNKQKKSTKGDKKKKSANAEIETETSSASQPFANAVSDPEKTSQELTDVNDTKAKDEVKEKDGVKQGVSNATPVTAGSQQSGTTKSVETVSANVKETNSTEQRAPALSNESNSSTDKATTIPAVLVNDNKAQQEVANPNPTAESIKDVDASMTEPEKSSHKKVKKDISVRANSNNIASNQSSKNTNEQPDIASNATRNNEVQAVQTTKPAETNNSSSEQKEEPVITQTSQANNQVKTDTSDVSNSNPLSTNESKVKPVSSNTITSINSKLSEAKKSETISESASSAKTIGTNYRSASVPSPTVTTEPKQSEATTSASNQREKTAELLKDIPSETISSYKEYLQTKTESDKEAKQASALQEKIANMPSSPERDQIAQQANELNMQSIKTWQQAQAKLNTIKESNPDAEVKLSEAFPQTSSNDVEPVKRAATKTVSQPNDPLLSQAVTHREAAEKATDKPTETAELQKTKDLIIQSKDTKQPVVQAQSVGKENAILIKSESSASSSKKTDEVIVASAAPISSSPKTGSVEVETSLKGSTGKEITNVPATKESREEANAAATTLSPDNTSPVLSSKTLNIDESAIFTVTPTQAYSAANPIPIDPQLPEGLVFKVQIGAFHNPLPVESFKNVQPLTGETTRPGWIRYCVGLFRTFEPANVVKMEMRSIGYKDAFVVAYYNGKRINLFDAYAIINRSGTHEKELYAVASEKESHHLSSMNIVASSYAMNNDVDAATFYGTSGTTPKIDESLIEYAVQVGVYRSNAVPRKLQSLIPLNVDSYKSNLYRFTTGRFIERPKADSLRLVAINTGVKDAFVVIYKGGSRAGENYTSSTAAKGAATANASTASSSTVKSNAIVFRIQIGAYKSAFSDAQIVSLKDRFKTDIIQSSTTTGYHLLYAGSYSDYAAAALYKQFLVAHGANDAFVVAFSGNTKIPVNKVMQQVGK